MARRQEARTSTVSTAHIGGSLITAVPAHHLKPDQSPNSINVDPSGEFGAAEKRSGFTKHVETNGSPEGSNEAMAYVHWVMNDGTEFDIIAEGAKLWDLTTNPEDDITGTYTGTDGAHGSFVPFNNKLYWFPTGGTSVVYDGGAGNFANPTASPASGNHIAVSHKGRVYVAGDPNNPSKVLASALEDAEDWSTADDYFTFTVNKDDGDIIIAMISAGDMINQGPLYIFKRNSVHIFTGTGPNDTEAGVYKVADVGCVGNYAVTKFGTHVFFASRDGVYLLNGGELSELSPRIKPTYEAIANKTSIVLGRYKNQIWVVYDNSGNGTHDSALVLDFTRGNWGKYTNMDIHALDNIKDGSLVGLNRAGSQLYKYDSGTTDDSAAISMTWETPDIFFDAWQHEKTPRAVYVFAKHNGTASSALTIKYKVDGGTATSLSTTLAISGTAGTLAVGRFPFPTKRKNFFRLQFVQATSGETTVVYGYALDSPTHPESALSS